MKLFDSYDSYFLVALTLLMALLVFWIVGNWQETDADTFIEQAARIKALEEKLAKLEKEFEEHEKECFGWYKYYKEK